METTTNHTHCSYLLPGTAEVHAIGCSCPIPSTYAELLRDDFTATTMTEAVVNIWAIHINEMVDGGADPADVAGAALAATTFMPCAQLAIA